MLPLVAMAVGLFEIKPMLVERGNWLLNFAMFIWEIFVEVSGVDAPGPGLLLAELDEVIVEECTGSCIFAN